VDEYQGFWIDGMARMLHQFSHETFPEAQIYRQGCSSSIVQFGRFELSRITMDNKDLAAYFGA
jgi:hypothetical protein